MSSTLVANARNVASLMELCAEMGGSPDVRDTGEVFLAVSADTEPHKIGSSIKEAVAHLRNLHDSAQTAVADGPRN